MFNSLWPQWDQWWWCGRGLLNSPSLVDAENSSGAPPSGASNADACTRGVARVKKLPVKNKSRHFDLKRQNCSTRHCKSAEFPECIEWPGYPTNGFFLPWWHGHIPGQQCQDSWDDSSCERVEHEDTWVSRSMRSHFHTWLGHHGVLTLIPLKVFGVKRKDWRNGLTLLSSIQNLVQKWMQLWMEINVVTLHKFVETMPQQNALHSQSKRRLLQKANMPVPLFGTGSALRMVWVGRPINA